MRVSGLVAIVVLVGVALVVTLEWNRGESVGIPESTPLQTAPESRSPGDSTEDPVKLEPARRVAVLNQGISPATEPLAGTEEPAVDTVVEEPDWQSTYARMSLAELKVEQLTLVEQAHELTSSAFHQYMEMGRYEVVGKMGVDDARLSGKETRTSVCTLLYNVPSGEIRKVVLPESEFPDAYRNKRRRYLVVDAIVALRD